MSESASSSMGFTICSLKIFLLTLRAQNQGRQYGGEECLTFSVNIFWKIYSLGLAKLRWLWFKYCSWIAREVLKKKCEFSNRLCRQNWLPCLLRNGLFCAWGHRNKKRPLKPSVTIHLSLFLTLLVPRWLLSGITLVLSLSWVKQVFFSIYFLSPCIFVDTNRPLSASPKLLCCILSSWCKERQVYYWFSSWSFQDCGMGLWLCFSAASLALLFTVHSPLQPLLEHCGCSWALSPEHNYRIHT